VAAAGWLLAAREGASCRLELGPELEVKASPAGKWKWNWNWKRELSARASVQMRLPDCSARETETVCGHAQSQTEG